MTRTSNRLPVLLVALLALSVGAVGTATASGPVAKLTTAKVKKIAKKVVKKQAPKLSVANATNLAGKPAAAYQDGVTVHNVTFATSGNARNITIPVAPGNYHIGYSAFLTGATGYTFCQIQRARTSPSGVLYVADDSSYTTSQPPSVSAVGVVDVLPGDVLRLHCSSATAFSATALQPIQIIVTPLDSVTNGGPLTASKGTAGRPGA